MADPKTPVIETLFVEAEDGTVLKRSDIPKDTPSGGERE